ncbi:MAG TPA: hypothetical protein VF600_18495 [Abditibacteriaceae bacterium]|jgi:hypothetical protein
MPQRNIAWRVLNEKVDLDIYCGYYTASIKFKVRNSGAAQAVTMAFPEWMTAPDLQPDLARSRSAFTNFGMWFDGQRVAVRRKVIRARNTEESRVQRAAWMHRVYFQDRKIHTIYVNFRAPYVENYVGVWAAYNFTPLSAKRGPLSRSFSATFHTPGVAYVIDADVDETELKLHCQGARCTLAWPKLLHHGMVNLHFGATVPGWLDYDVKTQDAVSVPGALQLGRATNYIWLPPALVRGGVTYVSLSELRERLALSRQAREKAITWDGDLYKGSLRSATLHAGRHRLRFSPGQSKMFVDGKAHSLSSKPFVVSAFHPHDGPDTAFYVPIKPVLQVLGGTMNVNMRAHRFYLAGPLFRQGDDE